MESPQVYRGGLENLLKGDWESFSREYPIILLPSEVYSSIRKIFEKYNKMRLEILLYLLGVYINSGDTIGIILDYLLPKRIESRSDRVLSLDFTETIEDVYNGVIYRIQSALERDILPMFQEDFLRILLIECHNHPSGNLKPSLSDRLRAIHFRRYTGGIAILGIYASGELVIFAKKGREKWPPFIPLEYKIVEKSPERLLKDFLEKYLL